METPEPPGPPKLNNREPLRSSPLALDRISARSIVSPSGSDQSSGARSVAHCQSPSGAGASSVPLHRAQSRVWDASAFGTPDGAAAEGAALLLPPSSLSSSDEPPLQPAVSSAAAAVRAVHRTRRAMSSPPWQAVRAVRRMALLPW
ncbi:hypothetical protein RKD40_002724 [Streptomyces ambofaciens]